MKKKAVMVLILTVSVVLVASMSVFAMAGGIPALHGVTGNVFGSLVSEMAKSEPGAVAAHVGADVSMDDDEEIEGEPEEEPEEESEPEEAGESLREIIDPESLMTGREFGKYVSELAGSAPGAVAALVRQNPAIGDDENDADEEQEEEEPEIEMEDPEEGAGGLPAAHGLSGAEFGQAVSDLAQSDPSALADHVGRR